MLHQIKFIPANHRGGGEGEVMSRSVIFLSKEKWQGPPARARCSLFVPWEMNVLAASKLGAVLKKKQGPAECRSCRLALSVLPLHQLASSLLLPASLKEGKTNLGCRDH